MADSGPVTITQTTRHAVDPSVCAAIVKVYPSLQAELVREGGCFTTSTITVTYPTTAAYQHAQTPTAVISGGGGSTCWTPNVTGYDYIANGPLQSYEVEEQAYVTIDGCHQVTVYDGEHWCWVVYSIVGTTVSNTTCDSYPSPSGDLSIYLRGMYWVSVLGTGYTETQYIHVQDDGNYSMWGNPYS